MNNEIDDTHIIDWILESTSSDKNWQIKHGKNMNWKQNYAVYNCDGCNYVYEELKPSATSNKKMVVKYKDFPKYKLVIRKCLLCRKD